MLQSRLFLILIGRGCYMLLHCTLPDREVILARGPAPLDWYTIEVAARFERGDRVRERVAFTIMVAILIFLFAFTFAILGKGEYQPKDGSRSVPAQATAYA